MPNDHPPERDATSRGEQLDLSGLITCLVGLAFIVLIFFSSCGSR